MNENLFEGIVWGVRKNLILIVLYEVIFVGCVKVMSSGERFDLIYL